MIGGSARSFRIVTSSAWPTILVFWMRGFGGNGSSAVNKLGEYNLPVARRGHQNETGAYRPDIDGLRAVSILLVVGYHAQPWLVPGGFIGVDIFFVISGFLITRIILSQVEANTFSFLEFYSRRIRRIFPALIVVLAVTYLIGWFVLLPDGFSMLGKSMAAGVAFVSNLFQLGQVGYFAADAAENPLLHLWSLGIEEQFYIFWPPALLLMFGSKRRRTWMAAIAAASFGVSLMIFFGYKDSSFYSPIPRAWELLAGGIVANDYTNAPESEKRRFAQLENLGAMLGVAAISFAAITLNRESSFPGLYALLPVAGAVLIIRSPNSLVNRTFLSNPQMVLIGLISYPLYLWHWPLLSYLGIVRNGAPNVVEIWVTVLVAIVLSWLTFRFVEMPLRREKNAAPKLAFGLATVGMAGIVTVIAAGFGFRFSPEIRDIAQLASHNNAGFSDKCFLDTPGSEFNSNCIEQGDKPLVLLWGDSTAAALYPGLKNAQATVPFRLARFTASACPPVLAAGSDARCDAANEIVLDMIRSSHPEMVLLHAWWDGSKNLEKLRETIGQLKALDIGRIVILGPVPVWKRTLPHALVNFYRLHHAIADRITTGVSGPEGDERMKAFSKAAGVEYISAWRALCDSEGCMTRVGPAASDVITTDRVHLSDVGSNFLIERISRSLFPQPDFDHN
jgi:peptidoglycan/LPS O-acetylase OafA/YrhL